MFRMGELHVVFAMLKVVGKYIDASGLDESFVEADIYGPNTLEQIKRGKHYKRSFEAFVTLYRTLFSLYIEKYLEQNVVMRIEVREICLKFLNGSNIQEELDFKENHEQLMTGLNSLNFFHSLDEFGKRFEKQPKFLWNYMKLFEVVLLFIRATQARIHG